MREAPPGGGRSTCPERRSRSSSRARRGAAPPRRVRRGAPLAITYHRKERGRIRSQSTRSPASAREAARVARRSAACGASRASIEGLARARIGQGSRGRPGAPGEERVRVRTGFVFHHADAAYGRPAHAAGDRPVQARRAPRRRACTSVVRIKRARHLLHAPVRSALGCVANSAAAYAANLRRVPRRAAALTAPRPSASSASALRQEDALGARRVRELLRPPDITPRAPPPARCPGHDRVFEPLPRRRSTRREGSISLVRRDTASLTRAPQA